MDFLLILLAIGGLVVAGVMLVLAARAARMQRESDARVQTLQVWATGSVLFASDAPAESPAEWAESPSELADLRLEAPPAAPVASFEVPANAYPFVMTVAAGADRVPGSFDRTQRRSRT